MSRLDRVIAGGLFAAGLAVVVGYGISQTSPAQAPANCLSRFFSSVRAASEMVSEIAPITGRSNARSSFCGVAKLDFSCPSA